MEKVPLQGDGLELYATVVMRETVARVQPQREVAREDDAFATVNLELASAAEADRVEYEFDPGWDVRPEDVPEDPNEFDGPDGEARLERRRRAALREQARERGADYYTRKYEVALERDAMQVVDGPCGATPCAADRIVPVPPALMDRSPTPWEIDYDRRPGDLFVPVTPELLDLMKQLTGIEFMVLLEVVGMFKNGRTGTLIDTNAKSFLDNLGLCAKSFKRAMGGLERKGLIARSRRRGKGRKSSRGFILDVQPLRHRLSETEILCDSNVAALSVKAAFGYENYHGCFAIPAVTVRQIAQLGLTGTCMKALVYLLRARLRAKSCVFVVRTEDLGEALGSTGNRRARQWVGKKAMRELAATGKVDIASVIPDAKDPTHDGRWTCDLTNFIDDQRDEDARLRPSYRQWVVRKLAVTEVELRKLMPDPMARERAIARMREILIRTPEAYAP